MERPTPPPSPVAALKAAGCLSMGKHSIKGPQNTLGAAVILFFKEKSPFFSVFKKFLPVGIGQIHDHLPTRWAETRNPGLKTIHGL